MESKKQELLGSSGSKKGIEKIINSFYYSVNYFVNDSMQIEHRVSGKKLVGVKVVMKGKKRWQFVMVQ